MSSEHQEYPKWVDTSEVERTYGKDEKPVYKRVLVQNEKEEKELAGKKKEEPKKEEDTSTKKVEDNKKVEDPNKKPWVDPNKK